MVTEAGKKFVGEQPKSHNKTHMCSQDWSKNKPIETYTNSLKDKPGTPLDKYTPLQTHKHYNANISGHPWTINLQARASLPK